MRFVLPALLVAPLAALLLGACSDSEAEVVLPDRPERLTAFWHERLEVAVQAALGEPHKAERHAQLALIYQAQGLWSEARRAYEAASTLDPAQESWALHAGICALEGADTEGARRLFTAAVERFPNSTPIHQRLGEFLLEDGDFEGAKRHFERTVQLAPARAEGYIGLGDALLRSGELDAAETALQSALERDPQNKLAQFLLGSLARTRGEHARAEPLLTAGRDARRGFIGDAWASRLREYVDAERDRELRAAREAVASGRVEQSLPKLEALAEAFPANLDILEQLALTLGSARRLDAALAVIDRALALTDADPTLHINRANCLMGLSRFEEARRAATRAIEIAPNSGEAFFMRAGASLALGEREQASVDLRAACSLQPDNELFRRELQKLEAQ